MRAVAGFGADAECMVMSFWFSDELPNNNNVNKPDCCIPFVRLIVLVFLKLL